jgi:hypothetical protein
MSTEPQNERVPGEKDAKATSSCSACDEAEFRRRLDLTANLNFAITGLAVAYFVLQFFLQGFPRIEFTVGLIVATSIVWIYCRTQLGCPRCGYSQPWNNHLACCGHCGLRAKGVPLRQVDPSSVQHSERWERFYKLRRLSHVLNRVFLGFLLMELAAGVFNAFQKQPPYGLLLMAITVSIWIISRQSIMRCPDCHAYLQGSGKEQFCYACGTVLHNPASVPETAADR